MINALKKRYGAITNVAVCCLLFAVCCLLSGIAPLISAIKIGF